MKSTPEKKERLRQKIINSSILFASDDSEPVVGWLFDLRMLLVDPEFAVIAAELAWIELKQHHVDVLICTGVAGIMWATYLQQAAFRESGIKLQLMIVRSSKKTYNRKRIVEGDRPAAGAVAFYVDDLTNAGRGRNQCLEIIKQEKIDINFAGIVVIVDFWDKSRQLEAIGKTVIRLFRRHDLGLTRKDPKKSLIKDLNNPYMQLLTVNHTNGHEISSPPILVDNLLYVATNDYYVRCIDLSTKEIVWQDQACMPKWQNIPKGIINVMPTFNQYIYYTSYHGVVTKLNRFTGEVIWRILGDKWIHSSPVLNIDGSVVYFCTEYRDIKNSPGGDIVAVDADTGNVLWRTATNDLMPCTPCVDNDLVFTSSNNSIAYGVETSSGNIVWQKSITLPAKGKPLVINNKVIFVNEKGGIYVLHRQTGETYSKKRCAIAFRHCFPLRCGETDNFVVIDQMGIVKCFNLELELQWITRTRGSGNWYPIKELDSLFFCNLEGYIIELDQHTGEKLSYSKLNEVTGSPIALNNKFIVINQQKKGILIYER
jgi:outer membrane protein assembly factor BamB/orotate phosphoribosyltransferase